MPIVIEEKYVIVNIYNNYKYVENERRLDNV